MAIVVVDSAEARANFSSILNGCLTGTQDTLITRYGMEVAVVIPAVDYKAFEEQLMILRAERKAAEGYQAWLEDSSLARPYAGLERKWRDR